jgi:branched-chain amino acid transport system substrate-binding protein
LLVLVFALVSVAAFAAACGSEETTTTAAGPATTAAGSATTAAGPATTAATTATTGAAQPLPASIKVGAVIPLTGKYAGLGAQVKGGYELAVADINAAGGVDVGGTKIPIELSILDDESDPTKTVQQLETHASNGVVAYLGGAGSDLHAAAAGIAEKNKIAYLGIAFALQKVHEQGFKYLFSPFPKSRDHAKATFDLLDSFSPKPAKIAIFAEKTDWGAEMVKYWQQEADARGGYTLTVSEYAPGTTDYTSLILPAKDAGAEVLLALPNSPDGIAMMKQVKELGWNAKVYFLIRAPDPPTFGEALGADSDGVCLLPGWNAGLPYPGVKEMTERYQTMTGKPAVALTGPAYACVQILADSISRAQSVDRDAIRDAMAATDLDTMVGHVTFDETGMWVNALDPVNQWQSLKQALVFPANVALAPPIYPVLPWDQR